MSAFLFFHESSIGVPKQSTELELARDVQDHLITAEPHMLGFGKMYILELQNVLHETPNRMWTQSMSVEVISYDCPLITHIYDFVKTIAGGSLTAAQQLVDETANIAVNWCGGWHHAQRDKAEGFCYVNDIVIAIQKLREKYDKVLYIDLDIHHGDGVENAFLITKKVLTLSFHKHGPGFYPGSGAIADTGSGNGKLYSINVPLKDGIKDDLFFQIFDSVTSKVLHVFRPNAVVVQCGADCLNKDPIGTFNLTPKGLGECICKVLAWKLPLLFLGGGGYNLANTARYWTYLTSILLDQKIPSEIPEHRGIELEGETKNSTK
uniref:Histone deacetylase 8 n=1 Tax=Timema cristinae TaxID=61476 RepID=A0A7R9D4I1_TIMCR|nr:unnamed protein product [Timema cristinae]